MVYIGLFDISSFRRSVLLVVIAWVLLNNKTPQDLQVLEGKSSTAYSLPRVYPPMSQMSGQPYRPPDLILLIILLSPTGISQGRQNWVLPRLE